MNFKSATRFAFLAGLMCPSVFSHAISLEDVYYKALQNDPQLKIAQASFTANREALPQARAALLPSLNARAERSRTETDLVDFNNQGYTISLTQPVFSAAKWFTYGQGKTLNQQAQLALDLAQQQLILRSVESYLNVLKAQSYLETAKAQERAIKRRLDQTNAQFEVGLIAITDVQNTQASYDNVRVALIDAEGAVDNSYEALERLIGEDVEKVNPLNEQYPITNIEPEQPNSWVEKAKKQNLALRTAKTNIEVARKGIKIAKSHHLPTLDFKAVYDRDKGTATSDKWQTAKVIGLTLNVPIFNGGMVSSKSRQAQAMYDVALQSYENTLRGVSQGTRSLLRNLKTIVLSVAARQQSIVSSQAALDATSEGFEVGTRNIVDVLTAEQALYAAKKDYTDARFNYVLTLFKLKQQVGSLNPDDLLSLNDWLKN